MTSGRCQAPVRALRCRPHPLPASAPRCVPVPFATGPRWQRFASAEPAGWDATDTGLVAHPGVRGDDAANDRARGVDIATGCTYAVTAVG